MREARLIETRDVPLAEIHVLDRLRPVTEAGVAQLIASIESLGTLTDPVQLRRVRHQDNRLVLMAGAHRLAAARELGWTTIRAQIWDCNDHHAALFEIDDNLASRELTALERAVFMARRKAVYLALYPETAAGVAGGKARQNSANDIVSFAEATAQQHGKNRRWAERYTAIGERLTADEIAALSASPIGASLTDLAKIARMAPQARARLIDTIRAENPASYRAAQAGAGLLPPKPDDDETKLRAMRAAWWRMSARLKKRWLAELEAEKEIALIAAEDADPGTVVVDFASLTLRREG